MLEGRTLEQKKALVKNVTNAVVDSLGIKPDHVQIIIRTLSKEDMGTAGELPPKWSS
jgi:4-oxalocrotonate tautomerase